MDIDEALVLIEKQFGGKRVSKDEFIDNLIERGKACSTCRRAVCDCDCSCKACWGKPR
jgi:hypothetical protein